MILTADYNSFKQANPNREPGATDFASMASPIGISTLTSDQKPLNIAPLPQDTTDYSSAISSIPDYTSIISAINTPTQAETKTQESGGVLKSLISKITGMGGSVAQTGEIDKGIATNRYTEDYLKQFGYTGKADAFKQFQDVTTRLSGLKKEALAIPLRLQEESQGRGVTAGGLAPIQTGQLRQNAIQALTLGSIAEAIQGNITTASALATDAVNQEFAPLEAELKAQMFNYQMNKDELERADKKKAQALEIAIAERGRLLENQKTDKNTILGFVAEASKNGAPSLLVQRASQLTNPGQALSMLSQYMSDPVAKQTALLQQEQIRANIAKVYSDMALSKEELAIKRQQQASTTVIDPTTGKPTTELKLQAKDSAKELLNKFIKGKGTQIVGKSRLFTGGFAIPGTDASDFKVQFDNLKSLISLENVKYLKGQGQITENERKLLADASTKLNLTQSEEEFRKTLVQTNIGFGNPQLVTLIDPKTGQSQMVVIDSDGLEMARQDGLIIKY